MQQNNQQPKDQVSMDRELYHGLIDAMSEALDAMERVRTLLRPEPSTMRPAWPQMAQLATAQLTSAIDRLNSALVPWSTGSAPQTHQGPNERR